MSADPTLSKFYQGRHALVYDMNTENETWEWVNLNEVMFILLLVGQYHLSRTFSPVARLLSVVVDKYMANLLYSCYGSVLVF